IRIDHAIGAVDPDDDTKCLVCLHIDGGAGTDTLYGPTDGTTWTIDAANGGSAAGITSFAGIENLVGGSDLTYGPAFDRFALEVGGSISGFIDGGAGLDQIIGPLQANTWTLSGADAGSVNGTTDYQNIENPTGGGLNDTFNVLAGATVSGVLSGGFDAPPPSSTPPAAPLPPPPPPVDTLSFASLATPVTVNLSLLTATGIAAFGGIDSIVGGSSPNDLLIGPGVVGDNVNWRINAANAGEVDGVLPDGDDITTTLFSSFESLRGRGASSDSFKFAAAGQLTGTFDGGTGGATVDAFAVVVGTKLWVFTPIAASPNPATLDGRTFRYAGMDAVTIDNGDTAKRRIHGTVFDDDIVLEKAGAGQLKVTFVGVTFFTGLLSTDATVTFLNPTVSLTIEAGSGGDKITVHTLDPAFKADLLLYGNHEGAPTIEPDAGTDNVIFDQSVSTGGGYLEVFADRIEVAADTTLSTRPTGRPLEEANDIVFRARRIGTPEIENLLPAGYLAKKTEIVIGARATVEAGSIFLISQAEDRALATTLGLTTLGAQMVLDPFLGLAQDFLSLPFKVLIKKSEATVTIGAGAHLTADYMVGVYATAVSDATGQAKSQLISVGYSQADAVAKITIEGDAKIEGRNGPVNITSDATATAAMSTATEREEQKDVPGRRGSQFAISLAVSYANVVSKTTLAPTAEVYGSRTVNIRALGESESEAEAKSSLFADGAASIALALEFSTSDILARIDGKVTADMSTNGGEVVKFEFDPTVPAANFTTNGGSEVGLKPRIQCNPDAPTDPATNFHCQLKPDGKPMFPDYVRMGDTVRVNVAVPDTNPNAAWNHLLMPAGTVFEYIGPLQSDTVDLSDAVQHYRDPTRWRVTSEPWGFVDYTNDRIAVYNLDNEAGNWVVVSEDTVDYSPRRGLSIGGLAPGTYYIIGLEDDPRTAVDESRYVKLGRTEQKTIDAGLWEGQFIEGKKQGLDPFVINLLPFGDFFAGVATTNTRSFDASDVGRDVDDSITFDGVGNTFELGQAVIYREPGRTDLDRVVEDELGHKHWRSPNKLIDGLDYVPLIEGLDHGDLLYTMVGVDQFNLIGDQRLVGKQVVQLGALENETRGGIARTKFHVNPGGVGKTGFTLSSTQILDSTFLTFGVVSALNATDTASAEAGFAEEDDDDGCIPGAGARQVLCVLDVDRPIFDTVFNKLMATYNPAAGGANAQAKIQLGGGIAFSYTDHNVLTWITNTADLNSNDDMELTSAIVEELTLSAESSGEEQPGKKDANGKATPNTSAKNAVSLGIVIGVQNNKSRSIIGCSAVDHLACVEQVDRPELDSMRALRLLSGVTYPFLTRPDEFVPTSFAEFADKIETEGFDYINTYLDGTLGLSSLFNTSARATTSADKLAIAGSVNVVVFTNTAESHVYGGAKINQDPFYRPPPCFYAEPGDANYDESCDPILENYDPGTDYSDLGDGFETVGGRSFNANNVDEHVVSIEATNYMQFMNLTGVFAFKITPSLELSSPLSNGVDDLDYEYKGANSLTPTSGGRGGIGGAFFIQILHNTTHAIVDPGVQLYSGTQSGLNIKAEEAIMSFSFAQAGASSGKVAVGGTFSYFEQHSDTLAQLHEGSEITGGRVDVYAGSLETQINWAGGVARSKSIGAGIAIAINKTERTTQAVIGEITDARNATAGPLTAPQGSAFPWRIDVAGAVTARAVVKGGLYAFTVAGAIANASKDKDKPAANAGGNAPAPADNDPLDGISLPLLFGETPPSNTAKDNKAGTSVAIAAAVGVNNVKDTTQASLADYTVTADAVDVKARNEVNIVAATGGLAFAKTDAGGNAAALAGGFSFNRVDSSANAFARDSSITLRNVAFEDFVVESTDVRFSLLAENMNDIWTLSAGGAGALAAGGGSDSKNGSFAGSLAGSVSVNDIVGDTRARMANTSLTLVNGPAPSDVRVRGPDTSSIFAIAGSLSFAIANGGSGKATAISAGLAIALNKISRKTEALVESSTIEWNDGSHGTLLVEATFTGSIKAFTVAGALGAALAQQSGSGVAGVGAGAGSVNAIEADVTASLNSSSTVVSPGAVTINAGNSGEIIAGAGAIAIAFAVSGQSTAAAISIGAAFAVNSLGRKAEHPADNDPSSTLAEIDHSTV
ncbi:MAG: hypothetical protein ACJ74P_03940, partial [Gaiellaceae bacterium]